MLYSLLTRMNRSPNKDKMRKRFKIKLLSITSLNLVSVAFVLYEIRNADTVEFRTLR